MSAGQKWTDEEEEALEDSVSRHMEMRGSREVIKWQAVTKDMREAGYGRSDGAYSARHHNLVASQGGSSKAPSPKEASITSSHQGSRWSSAEDSALMAIVYKYRGCPNWERIQEQLSDAGYERSEKAIIARWDKV